MSLTGANLDGKPVALPNEDKGVAPAAYRRMRALRALTEWATSLSQGIAVDLPDVARKHNIKPRVLTRLLQEDEELKRQFLGEVVTDAQIITKRALARAAQMIADPTVPPDMAIKWAIFAAKLAGGAYEKREVQPLIIANLIPQLPPAFEQKPAKVVDTKAESKILGDLTEE